MEAIPVALIHKLQGADQRRAAATSALSSQAPALLACAAHVSFLHICAAIAPGKIVHVPFPHWETWKVLSPSSPPCNVLSAGLSSALRRP